MVGSRNSRILTPKTLLNVNYTYYNILYYFITIVDSQLVIFLILSYRNLNQHNDA